MSSPDPDREVPLLDDNDIDILPDQTGDDSDEGWGDRHGGEDRAHEERMLEDRPPHW